MAAAKSFSDILSATVILAEAVINRPNYVFRFASIGEQIAAVDAARKRLVEGGGNPIGVEAPLLLAALAELELARSHRDEARASEFAMVAGVLLPLVRKNLNAALGARQ